MTTRAPCKTVPWGTVNLSFEIDREQVEAFGLALAERRGEPKPEDPFADAWDFFDKMIQDQVQGLERETTEQREARNA